MRRIRGLTLCIVLSLLAGAALPVDSQALFVRQDSLRNSGGNAYHRAFHDYDDDDAVDTPEIHEFLRTAPSSYPQQPYQQQFQPYKPHLQQNQPPAQPAQLTPVASSAQPQLQPKAAFRQKTPVQQQPQQQGFDQYQPQQYRQSQAYQRPQQQRTTPPPQQYNQQTQRSTPLPQQYNQQAQRSTPQPQQYNQQALRSTPQPQQYNSPFQRTTAQPQQYQRPTSQPQFQKGAQNDQYQRGEQQSIKSETQQFQKYYKSDSTQQFKKQQQQEQFNQKPQAFQNKQALSRTQQTTARPFDNYYQPQHTRQRQQQHQPELQAQPSQQVKKLKEVPQATRQGRVPSQPPTPVGNQNLDQTVQSILNWIQGMSRVQERKARQQELQQQLPQQQGGVGADPSRNYLPAFAPGEEPLPRPRPFEPAPQEPARQGAGQPSRQYLPVPEVPATEAPRPFTPSEVPPSGPGPAPETPGPAPETPGPAPGPGPAPETPAPTEGTFPPTAPTAPPAPETPAPETPAPETPVSGPYPTAPGPAPETPAPETEPPFAPETQPQPQPTAPGPIPTTQQPETPAPETQTVPVPTVPPSGPEPLPPVEQPQPVPEQPAPGPGPAEPGPAPAPETPVPSGPGPAQPAPETPAPSGPGPQAPETPAPSGPGPQAPEDEEQHPPHIHAIDVQCAKDMMTITIEFDKPYDGIIYSKGYYKDPSCRYVNAGSGQTKYVFTVKLNSCGTQFVDEFQNSNQAYLENVIVLQNEEGIQEVWDSIRSVRCLWEGNLKQELSVALSIGPLMQEVVTFGGDTGMARLDIQMGRGPFAPAANGLVKIGELMTLVVSVEGDPGFDVQVRACAARDADSTNVVQLTDDQGCVLKPKLLGAFQKTTETANSGASIIAYAFFNAFKFPDVMDLIIECSVDLCKKDCEMCPNPNQKIEPGKRRRRSVLLSGNATDDGAFDDDLGVKMGRRLRIFTPDELAPAAMQEALLLSPAPLVGNEVLEYSLPAPAQFDGVCVSTPRFLVSSACLLSILLSSCATSIVLWIKLQRSRSRKLEMSHH